MTFTGGFILTIYALTIMGYTEIPKLLITLIVGLLMICDVLSSIISSLK